MKYLAAVLVVLLALLQYRLWLGEGGMREVAQLRHQIQEQLEENETLRERNRTLAAEVQDLKQGTTAIEERARTDLGMVGEGETFFQVITPKAPAPPPAPMPAPTPQEGGEGGVSPLGRAHAAQNQD